MREMTVRSYTDKNDLQTQCRWRGRRTVGGNGFEKMRMDETQYTGGQVGLGQERNTQSSVKGENVY